MLNVDAVGAWTPLGGASAAAAAWRAGLSRASAPSKGAPSHDDHEAVTHLAPRVGGLEGVARLIRLIDLAFDDAGARPARRDVVLTLAGPPAAAWASPDEQRARLARSVGGACVPPSSWASRLSLLDALDEAREQTLRGAITWIVCADSLIDPIRIEAAAAAHQLKGPDQPAGFMPGEAAVVLRLSAAPSRLGRIAGWGRERIEGPPGAALARAIARAVEGGEPRHLHLDINGTEPRARTWGSASSALARTGGNLREWIPALSFGETGAASLALSTALALGRRVPGDAVVSGFDEQRAGALRVERS